jgi:GT2 family glycosyltransferase
VVAPALEYVDGTLQNNAYRRFPNAVTVFFDFCFPLGMLVQGRALDPHNLPNSRFDRPRRIAHATGAALLVRREAAEAAGPLDERFFLYYEETEWQRRIAERGWEIHLEPAARVRHIGGASSDGPAVASPHYIASVERYFSGAPAARRAMLGGARLSLAASRLRGALGRPGAEAQAEAYRGIIERLSA